MPRGLMVGQFLMMEWVIGVVSHQTWDSVEGDAHEKEAQMTRRCKEVVILS